MMTSRNKEQIDDLQKTVTNHGTRIETLETKAKATATATSSQSRADNGEIARQHSDQ